MKRKNRIQPSFASLSAEEKTHLADWLRKDTYDVVLERVNKPRDQGGFGLGISVRPLQVFREKMMVLDGINARLSEDKRLSIAAFEEINASALSAFPHPHPEAPQCEEVHAAILSETYDLVLAGNNTPSQLLSLQRLADFEARAELRAQKAEIE